MDFNHSVSSHPYITVIIPTRNSQATLPECLASLRNQDYPRSRLEIAIVDGGSTDKTLSIAKDYGVDKVIFNPFLTEEYGKSLGVRETRGDLVAFLDADNHLGQVDWLARMVEPFRDEKIVASEPLYYLHDKSDPAIVRYCSLVGSDDPVYCFLGYYDRYCTFKDSWTEVPILARDKGNYLHVRIINPKQIPTMGANGFVIRKHCLEKVEIVPFVHTDVIFRLVKVGLNDFAKVKIGLKHIHARDLTSYIRKKIRRARRFIRGPRPYNKISSTMIARFVLASFLLVPFASETVRGYKREPDTAWLLHMVLPFAVLMVYGLEFARKRAGFLS